MKEILRIFVLCIIIFFNKNKILLAQSNDCSYGGTPITVGSTCNPVAFNSTNNTDYWNSASGCSAGDYDDAWWWFTATATSTTITYNSSDDAILHVFTGSCATNMTAIACADNTASGNESVTITTVIGQNYAIRIQRYNSDNNMNGTICVYSATPPANDLCSNAISLPCGTTNLAGTTVNTTNVTHGTGCTISNYGVWYTFVGDGQQTTISSTAGSGFDHEMAIASGSCGSLTNITCQDAALSGGTETYTFTTTNGVTYYVYIAHYSTGSTTTGTFTISRTCTSGGSSSIQDCVGSMTICSDATVPGNASGQGTEEINSSNNGCLSSGTGENQSSWYVFSPLTSGNIALFMDVNTSTDYDWAIWGPYPSGSTTSSICPPNQQPIRCSFASGFTTNSETGSYDTGMGNATYSSPQFAPPTPAIYDGTGNTLNGWTPGIQVTAGQVYILLVDNWSADSNPFTLNFTLSGGATLGCTTLPIELLDFNVKNLGTENLIDWNTASEINSDYFIIERLSNDEKEFNEIEKLAVILWRHIKK